MSFWQVQAFQGYCWSKNYGTAVPFILSAIEAFFYYSFLNEWTQILLCLLINAH